MPCAQHTRPISDDLKWGKHLGGTHDDPIGVQAASMHHHAQHDHERIQNTIPKGVPPMEIRKTKERQKPAVLKKYGIW
jgi:hypothetical protein